VAVYARVFDKLSPVNRRYQPRSPSLPVRLRDAETLHFARIVRADPTRERRRERPRLARQLARARRGDRSFPTTGPRSQLPRSIGCPAGSERRNDDTAKQGTLGRYWRDYQSGASACSSRIARSWPPGTRFTGCFVCLRFSQKRSFAKCWFSDPYQRLRRGWPANARLASVNSGRHRVPKAGRRECLTWFANRCPSTRWPKPSVDRAKPGQK